jgi:hypothetical protein
MTTEETMKQAGYEVKPNRDMFAVVCGERILGLYERFSVAIAVCDALNDEEARRQEGII